MEVIKGKALGYLLGAIAAASYGLNPTFALPLYVDGMNPDSVLLFRYGLAIPMVAMMAFLYFIAGNIAMTFYRACYGFLTLVVAWTWLIGVAAVLLGLLIGSKVYDRLSVSTLRKVVYIFIGIAGIAALLA